MHNYLLHLSLFTIIVIGAFSPVDDLTAFNLEDSTPNFATDSINSFNLAAPNDLFAWNDNPFEIEKTRLDDDATDSLFSQSSETDFFSPNDNGLFANAATDCPSSGGGLSRRNDNTSPACSTTNQLIVPDLPTTLDGLANKLAYPSFPRLHDDDPVIQNLIRTGVQFKDERSCPPDSPYYLCCNCDPLAAFMVCLDCVPSEPPLFLFFFVFWAKVEGEGEWRVMPIFELVIWQTLCCRCQIYLDTNISYAVITLDGCYAPYMEVCCPVYGIEILVSQFWFYFYWTEFKFEFEFESSLHFLVSSCFLESRTEKFSLGFNHGRR